jgi:hypothetical protein
MAAYSADDESSNLQTKQPASLRLLAQLYFVRNIEERYYGAIPRHFKV